MLDLLSLLKTKRVSSKSEQRKAGGDGIHTCQIAAPKMNPEASSHSCRSLEAQQILLNLSERPRGSLRQQLQTAANP